MGSQVVLVVRNLPDNAGDASDLGLISVSERCPGVGNGNPLHYSCLENSMDRGAWWVGYSPWGCKELGMTEHACKHMIIED